MDRINGKPVAFVYTTDRERAVAYYRDTLGFTPQDPDDFGMYFEMGAALMRLTVIPDHKPTAHPVLGWSVPDIAATASTLKARGVRFAIYEGWGQDELGIWTSPDGASKIAFFSDPDGNVLGLSQG